MLKGKPLFEFPSTIVCAFGTTVTVLEVASPVGSAQDRTATSMATASAAIVRIRVFAPTKKHSPP